MREQRKEDGQAIQAGARASVQGLSRRASSSLAGSISARRLARSNTFAANESTQLNSLETWVEQGPHDAERLRAAAAKLTELSDKAQLKATEVEAAATAVAAAVAATNEMEPEPPVPPVVDDTTAAIDAELTIASRPPWRWRPPGRLTRSCPRRPTRRSPRLAMLSTA